MTGRRLATALAGTGRSTSATVRLLRPVAVPFEDDEPDAEVTWRGGAVKPALRPTGDALAESPKGYPDSTRIRHVAQFYTIGHSSRSIEEFLAALRPYGIDLVVDVRRFPGSDRNPQFDANALAEALAEHGIEYRHVEALGGRRSSPLTDSPNDGWENDSFQAYADYALSDAFGDALEELVGLAEDHTPAITCAEAVYWRCHRRIVADWLLAAGHEVVDVFGPDRADEHDLTRFAEVRDGRVFYPEDDDRA